jgi:hypothetical protein
MTPASSISGQSALRSEEEAAGEAAPREESIYELEKRRAECLKS